MKAMMLAVVTLALSAAACGGVDESTSGLIAPGPPPSFSGPAVSYPGSGEVTIEQPLTVAGHLEGTLRGIALSADTSDNYGNYTAYQGGAAFLSANIAARGDKGAGMLIVSLTDPALRDALLDGSWSSANPSAVYGETPASVSSCAGPTIGEWPYELGASDYEMESTEDPERPGTVVLTIKAHFPRSESDFSATTELEGTLRFEVPAAAD